MMFRARFKNDIVAEFLPPARSGKKQNVIILCDGMPSVPRKQPCRVPFEQRILGLLSSMAWRMGERRTVSGEIPRGGHL